MTNLIKTLAMSLALSSIAFADVTTLAPIRASGDIKVAPNGDIYVSDFGNPSLGNGSQVVRVSPDGTVETFAENLPTALAGNDFDSQGNLIQAAFGSNRIFRIDPNGNAATLTSINGPVGIVIDDNDQIYATQCNRNAIAQIDSGGNITVLASGSGLACPNGLDLGHDGALYTVNFSNGGMYRIGLDGVISLFATIPSGGNGHVVFSNGFYYVAGRVDHRIYRVDTTGAVEVFAGTGVDGEADGPNLQATVSRPNGIGASPDGRFIYFIGSSNFGASLLPLRQIEIEPATPEFEINVGLSGAWFNPTTDGQGLLFDVVPSNQSFVAAWFTFADAASTIADSASLGSSNHRWFVASGEYQGNRAELTLFVSEGGAFDDPKPATSNPVGTASIQFSSCTEAEFGYQFDSGASGSFQIQRVGPDELCGPLSP